MLPFKMKKVLFIMHMPPPVHGAAMVGQFIKDSEAINAQFDCRYINLTTASGLNDIGKGGLRKYVKFFNKMREIRRVVNEWVPDLIYVTPCSAGAPFYKDFVLVEMVKRWTRDKNVVLHFHNKGVKTRQDRWLDDKLYRRFFKGVKVILLSEGLYEDVKKYVLEDDILVCPNSIPCAVDNDACADEVEPNYVPRILWLTNLMRTKGLMEYLEALHILKDKGVSFKADFVGGTTVEMDETSFNNAVDSYSLNDCVTYYGRKYGHEKETFFKHADMFVLPSYTEAFPLTTLEAMQHGLPIVATNVGGISAQVEDGVNGLLIGGKTPIMDNTFRPDPNEIADALETLILEPQLREEMGRAGREKFEKEFTLERFEQRFVEIIRDSIED